MILPKQANAVGRSVRCASSISDRLGSQPPSTNFPASAFSVFPRHHTTLGIRDFLAAFRTPARPAALRSQIALLWASCGLGIPTPMPARNRSPPEKSRADRNPRSSVFAVSRGSATGCIPGFGSGSVREILGYDFGNRLIVFGF